MTNTGNGHTGTFRGCLQKIFDQAGTDADAFARAVDRSLDGRTASCNER